MVVGQPGFAKQFQDFQELARSAGGEGTSSDGSDSESAHLAEGCGKAARYSANCLVASIVAGTGGRAARASASTTELVAIPEQAIATAALAPSASIQPAPAKIDAWTWASGTTQGDGPTTRVDSGVEENTSTATDLNAPSDELSFPTGKGVSQSADTVALTAIGLGAGMIGGTSASTTEPVAIPQQAMAAAGLPIRPVAEVAA